MDWKYDKAMEGDRASRWWSIGLWTRLAFAGALGALAGVAMLLEGPAGFLPGLAFVAGGAYTTWLGWRGARDALYGDDEPPASRTEASAPPAPTVSPSRRPA